MTIYSFFLNSLLLFSFATLLRFSWYRTRFFLQIVQQSGYKVGEYSNWVSGNLFTKAVAPEHIWMNIIIAALLYLMSDRMTVTAAALLLSVFIIFWFYPVSGFSLARSKKPLVYTWRMKRLGLTFLTLFLVLAFIISDLSMTGSLLNTSVSIREYDGFQLVADPYFLFFGLVFIDMLIPFLLLPVMILLKPVEWRIQEGFKKKARNRLAEIPGLTVIAVTGSYGKTSTKFMIHGLLKERYNVCVTPGSYNTPMGICKVINSDLEAHHQVLILEMGARYPGNIRELCEIARPDIAVITNVGIAHLETFGSEKNIADEKATLARELKKEGILILNGDDEQVSGMSGIRDDVKVVMAGINNGSIRASNIEYNEKGTRFDLMLPGVETGYGEGSGYSIEMRLLGVHNVQNFLLASAVAFEMNMRAATITLAARQLKPVEHRLEMKKQGNLLVIDDAFNSNPVGAKNAVDILASFKTGRRIIVTPGMVELGQSQDAENRKLGEHIARSGLDLVILVGPEQTRPILNGILEVNRADETVRVVRSLFEANDIIREYARDGDVILYENDLPDTYNEQV